MQALAGIKMTYTGSLIDGVYINYVTLRNLGCGWNEIIEINQVEGGLLGMSRS